MSDLGTKIRRHYEETTPPIDINALVDRMESPPARPRPQVRRGLLIAFVAAVLVVIAVAIPSLLNNPSETPVIGPSLPAPTTVPSTLATTTTVPGTTTLPVTTTVPEPAALGPPVIDTYVEDITFDASGDMWAIPGYRAPDRTDGFASFDDEIYRFTAGTWASVELPNGFSLPEAIHWTASAASDGSLWLPGDGGLARYADDEWTLFSADYGCGSVAVDASGGAWGTCPDGLWRLDGDSFTPVSALGQDLWGWSVGGGPDGTIYMPVNGRYTSELFSFDGSEWTKTTCADQARSVFGCQQFLGVGPTGDVWLQLGYNGMDGLIRLADGTLEPEHVIGQADGAVDVAFTADGAAWFGVPADRDRDFILADDRGLILADYEAKLGLFRFDGADWRHYTTADGLASDSVNAVEVAPDGTLWVATDQGIDVYNEELDNFAPANP
ncbi:MAG: hypothetical protein HKO82_07330 [Acidimicrobiia bacterium]|nr:hypothetical protein [Acidimicrobiia bacterium]NNL13480.1 hypothetical protein [Acidimicrobiia bacterium]RZV45593.1 MAG: hypothetical protein EX267_05120 [Acidimicrobiia bacterium]